MSRLCLFCTEKFNFFWKVGYQELALEWAIIFSYFWAFSIVTAQQQLQPQQLNNHNHNYMIEQKKRKNQKTKVIILYKETPKQFLNPTQTLKSQNDPKSKSKLKLIIEQNKLGLSWAKLSQPWDKSSCGVGNWHMIILGNNHID